MPVSVATANDPFRGPARPAHNNPPVLRTLQARVLRALYPEYPDDPPTEWQLLTRALLGRAAGFTVLSGSCTRALNGIARAGSRMGSPHLGLLGLGLVEMVDVYLDSGVEVGYRITAAGIAAYQAFLANGGVLPPVKDATICTNDRYTNR